MFSHIFSIVVIVVINKYWDYIWCSRQQYSLHEHKLLKTKTVIFMVKQLVFFYG